MKLQELGEDRLLRKLTRGLRHSRAVVAGPGDDCAVLRGSDKSRLLLLKTDCIVEGIHFAPSAKPEAVGWKAMARPLSDFAAMSGVPEFALVTLIAPAATEVERVIKLYAGLQKAAAKFAVLIVGGETSNTAGPITVSVSISGSVELDRWVSRSGGRSGDELFVTGRLGGSLTGRHLRFTPRIKESRWLTAHFGLHAMMDLSDGLGADLPRLAQASSLGFDLDEAAIPRNRGCSLQQAISDGEDYELLFAVPASEASGLQRAWKKRWSRLPLTRIGCFNRKSKIENRKSWSGYVHFK